MRRPLCGALLAALLCLPVLAAWSARPAQAGEAPSEVEPQLKEDAESAAALSKLGAGESALLPKPRVAGDLNETARKYNLDKNGPGRRNYSIKLVWMADRKRAIYCGANHGSPHRLNDVWEFDLAANTWVCLYGPDDLGKSGNTWGDAWPHVTLRDGVLRTKRGGPAIIGHEWCQATYDPGAKVMLFNSQWPAIYYPEEIQEKYLKDGKYQHKMPMWTFSPATRTWEPILSQGSTPNPGQPANKYLEFVPELGGCAFVDAGNPPVGTWLFNLKERAWKDLLPGDANAKNASKNPALPYRLGVLVHCPGQGLLVACTASTEGEGRTVQYDIKRKVWEQTATGFEIPIGHPSFTPFGYDDVSGRLFLSEEEHRFQKEKRTAFWAYDVEKKKWDKLSPKGPPPPSKGLGYFDPVRKVFVICGSENVWVYRPQHEAPDKDK